MRRLRRSGWVLLGLLLASGNRVTSAQGPGAAESAGSDLAVDHVRKALAAERAAIKAHPKDVNGYVDLAYTLSDAGMNDAAVATMRQATEVAPKSSFAYDAQGWVLRHNVVGVDFGRGLDYAGAVASYEKAMALDPNDLDVRASYADLLDHDPNGVEWGSGARLDKGAELYRFVKLHQVVKDPENIENLALALFFQGLYQEALDEAVNGPHTSKLNGVAVSALTALKGAAAGIAYANGLEGSDEKKKGALTDGAEGMWEMRLYPQAADLLTASLPNPGAEGIATKIQLFRQLKPYDKQDFAEFDPRRPVARLLRAAMLRTLDERTVRECLSAPALGTDDWKSTAQLKVVEEGFRAISRRTLLPAVVVEDLVLGSIKINVIPSDAPGSRVAVLFTGRPAFQLFVVKDAEGYRIAGTSGDRGLIAREALYLSRHSREAEAIALLDWIRELAAKADEDDPLGGTAFSRVWTPGGTRSMTRIEAAIASLGGDRAIAQELLPSVLAAASDADTDRDKDGYELVLARMYLDLKDGAQAEAVSLRLLARHPESIRAAELMGEALRLQGKLAAWRALTDKALARSPRDRAVLLESEHEAETEGDYKRAEELSRAILDGGRAVAEDYDRYARVSLFAGDASAAALEGAEQANLMTQRQNGAYLTTVAWVDVALGRTAEARQLLLEAIEAKNLEEPDAAVWYGFGRIYEAYGERDAATLAYKRIERKQDDMDATSVAVLAGMRLKLLAGNK